jgi:hypothetical protein
VPGQPAGLPLDDQLLGFLDQERAKPDGHSLLLFGVSERANSCDRPEAEFGQIIDGHYRSKAVTSAPTINRFAETSIVPRKLPAGEYVIKAVRCISIDGRNSRTFNGPHAKFQIKAGEFVDIGVLHIDHRLDNFFIQVDGTMNRSVQPLHPTLETELTRKLPKLMAKLVRRPMTLVGPAEIRTKRKTPFS